MAQRKAKLGGHLWSGSWCIIWSSELSDAPGEFALGMSFYSHSLTWGPHHSHSCKHLEVWSCSSQITELMAAFGTESKCHLLSHASPPYWKHLLTPRETPSTSPSPPVFGVPPSWNFPKAFHNFYRGEWKLMGAVPVGAASPAGKRTVWPGMTEWVLSSQLSVIREGL